MCLYILILLINNNKLVVKMSKNHIDPLRGYNQASVDKEINIVTKQLQQERKNLLESKPYWIGK
jgi:hypothetical protein